MGTRSVSWAAAVALVGALVVAGCGDGGGSRRDDGGEDRSGGDSRSNDDRSDDARSGTTSPAGSGESSYCDAALAFETPPAPETGVANASEEQQLEVNRAHARQTLRPLASALVAAAPDEAAADAARLLAAVDELAQSGDYAVFSEPDVDGARDALHAYDLENCGWDVHQVSARDDHAFAGVPDRVEAGPASFELVNDGREVHELVLVRKDDDVTASAEELVEMPQAESQELITEVGYAFTAPGETDYLVADLEPGDYIGACFVATGTTDPAAPPAQGRPPHSAEGMTVELTVG